MKKYLFMPDNPDDKRPLPSSLFYTPLHDLESVWWLGSHFVCTRAVTDGDASELARYRVQHQDVADEIFGPGRGRHLFLRVGTFFLNNVQKLHPSVGAVGQRLNEARRALMNAHMAAERDVHNVDPRAAADVYKVLHDCFLAITAEYAEHDVHMERFAY